MEEEEDEPKTSRKRGHSELESKGKAKPQKKPQALDADALSKKHGLVYSKDGDIVMDQAGVDKGLYSKQALIEYEAREKEKERERGREKERQREKEREKNMMPLYIDNGNNNNGNSNTLVGAMKLKRICAADLDAHKKTENCEWLKKVERWRNKDMIYRLMMDNSDEGLALLDQYVILAQAKVEEQGLRPNRADQKDDIKTWDEMNEYLRRTRNVEEKRAYIWMALSVSSLFVEVFCPKTGGAYLTNATKLQYMLRSPESSFDKLQSAMLAPHHQSDDTRYFPMFCHLFVPNFTIDNFVSGVVREWIDQRPWEDMDTWAAANPTDPSLEVKLLLAPAAMTRSDRQASSQHFLMGRDESNVNFICAQDGDDD